MFEASRGEDRYEVGTAGTIQYTATGIQIDRQIYSRQKDRYKVETAGTIQYTATGIQIDR